MNFLARINSRNPIAESEPRKSKSRLKTVLAIIGGIVLLLVVIAGFGIMQGAREKSEVEPVLVAYMQAVSNNEIEKAYDLVSEEFKSVAPIEDFKNNQALFEAQYSGFQKLEYRGFRVNKVVGSPDVYQYFGLITYTNGDKGELTASLKKQSGVYKILGINVNIGVDRANAFKDKL